MRLYGGHNQTQAGWRIAPRPRENGETKICVLTQAVRDPELLAKGLKVLQKSYDEGLFNLGEINKMIAAAFQNGRLDPNKHPSYQLLNDFYSKINNGAQLPTYQLGL